MPPSAPADHLACSEKPSASWRQRGGLAACGAALVFLASIHGDRSRIPRDQKPCAAIGQGAAGRDDARGRPAAFRSAARPAAPGALMPTTAGFVVDEDDSGFCFSCLTWRFESRAQHTGQCAPRSLPARLGDLSPTSARRPRAHHQRAATAHTAPAGSPPSSPPVGAVRRHVRQNGDRTARAGVLLAATLSPPLRDRRRPRHRRRQRRPYLAPRASPSPPPPPALDLATASF